jgi:hypothetical protein
LSSQERLRAFFAGDARDTQIAPMSLRIRTDVSLDVNPAVERLVEFKTA